MTTKATVGATRAAAAQTARHLRSLLPQRADWEAVKRSPGRDIIAGVTVAVVALPLALAFGVASGLGAQAGLMTAIIAGALAAIFGGSNLQVSGPTGAMTVVLVPVVYRFGVEGVLLTGLMAGVMLLIMAVSRMGKYVRLLPTSLIEGFTAGIAVVIVLQQFPNIFGLAPGNEEKVWSLAWQSFLEFIAAPNPVPVIFALVVAAVILIGARWMPIIPFTLIMVVVATAAAELMPWALPRIGELPSGFNSVSLAFFDLNRMGDLLPSALAIAALAALESLLCATVADSMSVGEQHDPDRELFGQGLANLVAPMFGGVPATAAIARTAVNVRAGARSRLASVSHAAVLALIVLFGTDLVSKIPLAALAGVLLAVSVQMIEFGSIRALLTSTRTDAVVLLLTFAVTVAIDLVTAVVVGLAVAVLLILRSIAKSAKLEQVPLETDPGDSAKERSLLAERIVAYRLDGPLFFGVAHRFLLELTEVATVDVVILRMSRLTTLDATGARILDDAIKRLEKRGIIVLASGVQPEHTRLLRGLGVASHLRTMGRVFPDTPAAIAYARALLAEKAAAKPRTGSIPTVTAATAAEPTVAEPPDSSDQRGS
ncbi:SulP family inorganic anion transporter [Homoserinimonas sp. OAct 916]|uniref:SulP family inorganic anion transporter n=1 Tax=Homoserinimonas sp. OAct 916 TaxID=2211450 RepID=UPI001E44FAF2|nr:SulP family inorganic anion transporter [Homoserinimonas sp. OAct 916]